ncbi:HNH endonuclease [Gordonia sp. PP30]|uniref:HNH endonuclease signature motif containing protein n=1 Tax=Gordonia sp. PP30 TaxID=2935861 RepID=UPI001FFF0F2C|nr:HNH endonuclease signature motif containing protein [Gordonia sp. PP30]UQE73605.1 HNH endonuclease [Gordonia sp. PP30]
MMPDGPPDEFTSRWEGVDFTPAGMVAADENDDPRAQAHSWMVYAESAWRGQAFLYWRQIDAISNFLDLTLAELDDAVCAGADQKDLMDPYSAAEAAVAMPFAANRRKARMLVGIAVAASERLPRTAGLLRQTVISPEMFEKVVDRTDIVDDPAIVAQVDTDLATALATAGHVSEKAAERIADRIVEKHDRDASRKRHDRAQRRKNVTQRDYTDGLGGINITADAEETRLAYEAIGAMIAGVCPNDPRTKGALRSAAAIARLRRLPFTCACTDKEACTATLSDEDISERQARIIVHAVCRKTTLAGVDDEPGFLDGHGPISAGHVRDLARRPDALVRDLDLGRILRPPAAPAAGPTPPDSEGNDGDFPAGDPSADSQADSDLAGDRPTGHDLTGGVPEPPVADGGGDRAVPHPEYRPATGGGTGPTEPATDHTGPERAPAGSSPGTEHQDGNEHQNCDRDRDGDRDTGSSAETGTDDGRVPPVFLTNTAQPGDPYRPTAALDVLVRALFGTCTIPGCDQPAWHCELDHCEEFNQICPASGGPTCLCNINPKCQRHHLLKTHLGASNPADGWIDEQWIDEDGTVWTAITVDGMTFETRAENQWLFPDLAGATCAHQAQAPPEPAPAGEPAVPRGDPCTPRGGLQAVTAHKHAWRRAERARLRREREHAAELYGPPPF